MGIPLATGAIKTLRTNVVGSGLVPTPQVDADYLHLNEEQADRLQAQIVREFELWADSTLCDAAGMDNFWRLQTLAFTILSDAPMPEVATQDRLAMVRELAIASGAAGMCGGQALDLAAEGQQVDLAALERIHRHKTGALIRAAVRMGALSAGNSGHQWLPVLDKYAESIGLAFQVQDDILDVVGDTATLGKRQGADQQLGKSTYPALLGLEQARKKARDLIDDARQSLKQLAEQSLDTSALEALADYIIQRNK